jgi:hypothetical protein
MSIPSPSPPPLTQPQKPASKAAATRATHTQRGKMKKTAVDLFNNTCKDETQCLDRKWKMDHDKKMASMHLKSASMSCGTGLCPVAWHLATGTQLWASSWSVFLIDCFSATALRSMQELRIPGQGDSG